MDTKKLRQKILDLAIRGKLVPQEGKWKTLKIKDVFIINPKNKEADDKLAGFVPMSNIQDGYRDSFVCEAKLWGTIKKGFTHFADGDIAVAKISPCLENRKSMILANLPNGIGAGTTELIVFRCKEDIIPKYGLYFFKTQFFIDSCVGTFNGVVGQQRVGKNIVEEIAIPLPPLAEQKRIVTAIEQWFSLIDILENEKSDLQAYIQQAKFKILDLAIHGKLVPQDPNDEPAIELLKRINPKFEACDKEGCPFVLPKSWEWITMDQVSTYKSVSIEPSKHKDQQFELYSVPTFDTGLPEFVRGDFISSSKKKVEKGDVLLCKINPHLNRAWIVNHHQQELQCIASSEWIVFRNREIDSQYIMRCFTSSYFYNLMLSNVSGVGGSLMRAQPSAVEKYPFPLPPYLEQLRIVTKIEELFAILDNIKESLA